MTRWEYDLKQEADPVKRLGLHGLWRFLHYASGEDSERFPTIRQSETLKWEFDGTSKIAVEFESVEDANRLIQGSISMIKGICVPPGYPDNPDQSSFIGTIRAHRGILGVIFVAGENGGRRSKSLGGTDVLERVRKVDPETIDGLLASPFCFGHKGGEATYEEKVTTHYGKSDCGGEHFFKPLQLDSLTRQVKLTAAIHPSFGKWNDVQISMAPRDLFPLFFVIFSYAFTMCDDGAVAIPLDAETFKATDLLHRRFIRKVEQGASSQWFDGTIRSIPGSANLAAFIMLSLLDAPANRFYDLIVSSDDQDKKKKSIEIIAYRHLESGDGSLEALSAKKLMDSIRASMVLADAKDMLWEVRKVPLQVIKRTQGKSTKVTSVYDHVLGNIGAKRAWYTDLGRISSLWSTGRSSGKSKDVFFGLYPSESVALSVLFNNMGEEMDKKIVNEFRRVYRNYMGKVSESYKKPWERAYEDFVTTRLSKVASKGQLMQALAEISKMVGGGLFTEEVSFEILARADDNPRLLRDLLIFGVSFINPRRVKVDAESGSEATPEGPVESDVDSAVAGNN